MSKEVRLYNARETISLIKHDGKNGQLHVKKKKKSEHSIISYRKINSEWIKDQL